MYMEPAAARGGPWELQLATNWSGEEEPCAYVCAPAAGLPVEYASIDIGEYLFDSYNLEAYVPESSEGRQQQQLVEYYYSAAALQHHPGDSSLNEKARAKISNDNDASDAFEKIANEFVADVDLIEKKMHRYPPSLGALDECYTEPRIVAIGPYHHGKERLNKAEKWKHMAAYHCVKESGRLLEEVYGEVASAADKTRRLYDEDVDQEDFRHMMFFDACFLVQYIFLRIEPKRMDPSLWSVLHPIRSDISHDLMLLENQLPWEVVEKVMSFIRDVPLKTYIAALRGCLQDRKDPQETPFVWNKSYRPPHLLGLIRYYIVGRSDTKLEEVETESISFSVSAVELAEIGIRITPNKTTELIHMGLRNNKGMTLFPELFLAPLSLDQTRASRIVNMAAFELCAFVSFRRTHVEDSTVCSYLQLMAMLVHKEEDVQELRARGLMQGGGGLTDEEALRFFTSLQSLRLGSYYIHIMEQIESYKVKRRMQTKLHAFLYNNMKTIAAVVSGIGAVGGIIGTLVSLKGAL